jgi:hypothetical protein
MNTPPLKPVEGNGPAARLQELVAAQEDPRVGRRRFRSPGPRQRYQQRGEPAQARSGRSRDPERGSHAGAEEDPGPEGRGQGRAEEDHRTGQAGRDRQASTGHTRTGRARCGSRAELHRADAPRLCGRNSMTAIDLDEHDVCDHGNCPAEASATITTPAGDISLCSHHLRESESGFRAKGYPILLRYWLVRELPGGQKIMRDQHGMEWLFTPE